MHLRAILFNAAWPFIMRAANAAAAPPSSCDPTEIQECLSRFEARFAECDDSDKHCQCMSVLTNGASCYSACPQESRTKFIETYSSGLCATYDPHMQIRSLGEAEAETDADAMRIKRWLGIDVTEGHDKSHAISHGGVLAARGSTIEDINQGDALTDEQDTSEKGSSSGESQRKRNKSSNSTSETRAAFVSGSSSRAPSKLTALSSTATVSELATTLTSVIEKDAYAPRIKALTLTAAEPTATTSLSPQEYESRQAKLRIKENLRSIRSSQASESSLMQVRKSVAAEAAAHATARVSDVDKAVEKDVHAMSSASVPTTTVHKGKEKEHKNGARAQQLNLALLYPFAILVPHFMLAI